MEDTIGLRARSESLQLGDLSSSSGSSSGGGGGANSVGGTSSGHLRLDPNLPISFQFHTYSNLSQSAAASFPNDSLGSTGSTTGGNRRRQNQNSAGRMKSASFSAAHRGAYGTTGLTTSGQSIVGRRGPRNASISEGPGLACGSSPSSFASTRHRELHKTLEKNRRAHLRSCFEQLKQELPKSECAERKCSHINIIHLAIKHIEQLQQVQTAQQSELQRLSDQHQRYLHTVHKLTTQLDDIAGEDNGSSTTPDQHLIDPDSPYGSEHLFISTGNESHLPIDIASVECVVTEKKPVDCPTNSEHTRQMDQLLLQVQRTLYCGTETSNNENQSNSSQSLNRDHSVLADYNNPVDDVDLIDDDDNDGDDEDDRLDIDLDDTIEVNEQFDSNQSPVCHQYVDETTNTSGELRVVC